MVEKIESNHKEIDSLKERMLRMHEKHKYGGGEDSERVLKKVEDMNSGALAEIQKISRFENEKLT